MKKQKQNFDTMFWAGYEIKNAIKVIEAVFSYASLDHYKQIVNNAVLYAQKPEVYNKHEPCELFRCYAILRSFYRACAKLESKNKKKKEFQIHTTCKSILHQTSLSKVEYDNPIIVFKKTLTENAVKDYECFFASMVEMALSHHQLDYEPNWFNYYLHTVKMLDASQLLLESNTPKVKIKKQAVEVQTQLPQIHKNLLLVSSRNNHNETITNEPINRREEGSKSEVYYRNHHSNGTRLWHLLLWRKTNTGNNLRCALRDQTVQNYSLLCNGNSQKPTVKRHGRYCIPY